MSSCGHSNRGGETKWEKRTTKKLCAALNDWVSAGPRTMTSARGIMLPDAYANANDRDDDFIVLTAFSWDYLCPEDTMCEDEADTEFRQTLRIFAHSLNNFGYFERLEPCIAGSATTYEEDRSSKNQMVRGRVADRRIDMRWESQARETHIIVQFK